MMTIYPARGVLFSTYRACCSTDFTADTWTAAVDMHTRYHNEGRGVKEGRKTKVDPANYEPTLEDVVFQASLLWSGMAFDAHLIHIQITSPIFGSQYEKYADLIAVEFVEETLDLFRSYGKIVAVNESMDLYEARGQVYRFPHTARKVD